jgi:hypothetical protein
VQRYPGIEQLEQRACALGAHAGALRHRDEGALSLDLKELGDDRQRFSREALVSGRRAPKRASDMALMPCSP